MQRPMHDADNEMHLNRKQTRTWSGDTRTRTTGGRSKLGNLVNQANSSWGDWDPCVNCVQVHCKQTVATQGPHTIQKRAATINQYNNFH